MATLTSEGNTWVKASAYTPSFWLVVLHNPLPQAPSSIINYLCSSMYLREPPVKISFRFDDVYHFSHISFCHWWCHKCDLTLTQSCLRLPKHVRSSGQTGQCRKEAYSRPRVFAGVRGHTIPHSFEQKLRTTPWGFLTNFEVARVSQFKAIPQDVNMIFLVSIRCDRCDHCKKSNWNVFKGGLFITLEKIRPNCTYVWMCNDCKLKFHHQITKNSGLPVGFGSRSPETFFCLSWHVTNVYHI